jgi:hypothetical protein
VATRVARRHGLRWYNADARTWEHRDRAIRAGSAAAIRWEAMTPRERLDVEERSELLELSLHRERGPMVVDDLLALPSAPLVVAEGTTLPAAAVPDRSRAAWLIPTEEFQQARLEERRLPRATRELFLTLTEAIEAEARASDVPIFVVDGSRDVAATAEAIEHLFEPALAGGPRAQSVSERRSLLREANEAVVAQVRAGTARPWADVEGDQVVRTFLCECGDPACDRSVDTRVGVAAAGPIFAPGHG